MARIIAPLRTAVTPTGGQGVPAEWPAAARPGQRRRSVWRLPGGRKHRAAATAMPAREPAGPGYSQGRGRRAGGAIGAQPAIAGTLAATRSEGATVERCG